MTLQIALSPELEERLRQEAERRGQPRELVALRLLDEHLPPREANRRAAAVAMLERWAEEDAALSPKEQAANTAVLRALDEDRPSYRKLFTDILKDAAP
jgi:predicted transcriptional regulator